jgi:hypothetical protein
MQAATYPVPSLSRMDGMNSRGQLAATLALFVMSGFGLAVEPMLLHDGGSLRQFELAVDERATIPPTSHSRQPSGVISVGTLPVIYEVGSPHNEFTRRIVTGNITIRLNAGEAPGSIAKTFNLRLLRTLPFAGNIHVFAAATPDGVFDLIQRLREHPAVQDAQIELARKRARRLLPTDPMFLSQ